MAFLISGCNQSNNESYNKIYIMKNCDEAIKPYVVLCQTETENTFSFMSSAASSYMACGSYQIKNNVLTLNSDDGNKYVFKIDGDTLIFNESKSSEIKKYKGFVSITDNTVFELEK